MKILNILAINLRHMRHYPVIDDTMIKNLRKASDIMLKAGMLGSNEEGLFKPK